MLDCGNALCLKNLILHSVANIIHSAPGICIAMALAFFIDDSAKCIPIFLARYLLQAHLQLANH